MTGRVEGLHNNGCPSRYLLDVFLLTYICPPFLVRSFTASFAQRFSVERHGGLW